MGIIIASTRIILLIAEPGEYAGGRLDRMASKLLSPGLGGRKIAANMN
jgi:hypothetical protein